MLINREGLAANVIVADICKNSLWQLIFIGVKFALVFRRNKVQKQVKIGKGLNKKTTVTFNEQ
jgi:hypothetical protein